jgi:hypothetical protein
MLSFLRAWVTHLKWREVFQLISLKTVRDPDGPIMTQFTLVAVLGFHLRIHIFHRADGELFHSHPRHFVSLGLCGEYVERLCLSDKERRVRFGTLTFRKATDKHNVTPVEFPCVTLVITSPVVREWDKGECVHEGEEGEA